MNKLTAKDKETREEALWWLLDAAFPLATSKGGCRLVQTALEVADAKHRGLLLDALAPKAVELYESPHGNWCLCKAVLVLPAPSLAKIERTFEEVSKHKFGCRLMERLIEHLEPTALKMITDEIIPKALCFN
eukprot:g6953.t1